MALGIILAPYGQIPGAYPSEIGYSYGGNGTFAQPNDDASYNTRGEPGFYHDTQLGSAKMPGLFARMRRNRALAKNLRGLGRSVPSDFDLAPTYGFTPVMSGWVAAKEGYQQGSWIPPNGWNPAGAYGPQMATPGVAGPMFRDGTTAAPVGTTAGTIVVGPPPTTPDDVIAVLNAHNQRVFTLTLLSTAAVAISAIVTTIRTARLIKAERKLEAELVRR